MQHAGPHFTPAERPPTSAYAGVPLPFGDKLEPTEILPLPPSVLETELDHWIMVHDAAAHAKNESIASVAKSLGLLISDLAVKQARMSTIQRALLYPDITTTIAMSRWARHCDISHDTFSSEKLSSEHTDDQLHVFDFVDPGLYQSRAHLPAETLANMSNAPERQDIPPVSYFESDDLYVQVVRPAMPTVKLQERYHQLVGEAFPEHSFVTVVPRIKRTFLYGPS